MQLRPYQVKSIELLRSEISKGIKRPLLFLATGAGKGLIMSELASNVLVNGKKILVVMRRSGLIHQTKANFERYHKIKSSIIMAQVKGFNPNVDCQICSIDTIRVRMKDSKYDFLKMFDVVIIDEAHDINSPTYQKFIEWIGDKIVIGFTATPFSMGGKPLKTWQSAVKPIEMEELKELGFLAGAKVYCPAAIDVSGLKVVNGDYSAKELYEKVTDKKIIGDIVETYIKYGKDLPALLFAVNKNHSMLMAHAFNEAGIKAVHQEDSHTQDERESAIADLVSGKIKILCNCNIFSTGTDIPSAVVGIMARPTMSETLYVQQVGRLLRPHESKDFAIILDHAGNTYRHGLPFDSREASLDSDINKRKRKESGGSAVPVKTCPDCYAVIPAGFSECPECHHVFVIKDNDPKHADGELAEVQEGINFKLISRFNKLKNIESFKRWLPNAKFFILYEEFGDEIYKYTNAPDWIGHLWRKNCPSCKSKKSCISLSNNNYKCNDCNASYTAVNNKKELNGTDARITSGF